MLEFSPKYAGVHSYIEYMSDILNICQLYQIYVSKICRCTQLIKYTFKIICSMILHTHLYHFILKYNIYTFVYKLSNFLKIRMAAVEAIIVVTFPWL